jgi:glycerol-3-phosphate dehydrogenase (NAD(P)+)
MNHTVCVIGEGAWGTAVATLLAHNGYTVNLWCYHAHIAGDINCTRVNTRYMPGYKLSSRIYATTDMARALDKSAHIFVAIPVQYLRSICTVLLPHLQSTHILVALSKGIEKDALALSTDIMDDVLGSSIKKAVIAGPSFAHDLIREQPTGFVVASHTHATASALCNMLKNEFCTLTVSADVRGVQLCSAIKNVIALGVGILDGAQYGDNTKTLFVMRCIDEMCVLVKACGGSVETVYGLAGIGDIMLTAYGMHSRNVIVGRRIGAGERLDAVIAATGHIPEGVNTVLSIHDLARHMHVTMPLCQEVYNVLHNNTPIKNIARLLR